MESLDERITRTLERAEQLKRQKKAKDYQEKKRQAAIDIRRQQIIGRIVSEHFPELMRLQPRRREAENRAEFAPLSDFLTALAADTEYIRRTKEMATKRTESDILQGPDHRRCVSGQTYGAKPTPIAPAPVQPVVKKTPSMRVGEI